MYHPKPDFPPLYAPAKWWRLRMGHLLKTGDDIEAIIYANNNCDISNRNWMRFEITRPRNDTTLLSLPVAGGGSALKNRHASTWRLSPECNTFAPKIDHTLSTLLGNTPYFGYIFPTVCLKEVILQAEDSSAENICRLIDHRLCGILGLQNPSLLPSIRQAVEGRNAALKHKIESALKDFNPDISFLEYIMRYGPEAIFLLLPSF